MIEELPGFAGNNKAIEIHMFRGDKIHPEISGNKWWKLKYNIAHCRENNFSGILTFGGAYSNHLAAVAASGKIQRIPTVGIVRGDEVKVLNETLQKAAEDGMKLIFVSREEYRNRNQETYHRYLREQFPNHFIVPEGGSNVLAVKGIKDMMMEVERGRYDMVCVPVGTGGTMAGIIASGRIASVLGFAVLKQNGYLTLEVQELLKKVNERVPDLEWLIEDTYHFGGYAKLSRELVLLCNEFIDQFGIELDYIYTAKMMYGIRDMIIRNKIPNESKILVIHTGGIQGNAGMKKRYSYLFDNG